MPRTKSEKASAQANVKDAENAPEGANVKPKVEPMADPVLPKGKLFVVKDLVSGHIHSDPLPKDKAEAKLKLVSEKEKREHPAEAQYDFQLVEFNHD